MSTPRQLSLTTATMLVVASMIGTGVFTTTGFLVADLHTPRAVLVCWTLGGVAALCGALAYGELAAAFPKNGGEYALPGRRYHPAPGFVAGFVSLFVGFAAPIAAGAIAFGAYLHRAVPYGPDWWPQLAGCGLIVLASLLHASTVRTGSRTQNLFTALKALLLLGFIGFGLEAGIYQRLFSAQDPWQGLATPEMAVGLVYVSFAYTGWNAAVYVAGETRSPEKNIPRALLLGTLVVTVLYVALNVVFLISTDLDALSGQVEVGHVAAEALFGPTAARVLSLIIALGLLSTVGAMVLTGPRIYEAMGKDHPRLAVFAVRRAGGGPTWATWTQAAVSIAMALTASFDALLVYAGVSLSLFAGLTALGVFVSRWREPELERPYRTWLHPWTTLVFLGLTGWMMVHSLLDRPVVALYAGGTLLVGVIAWAVFGRRTAEPTSF